MLEFYLRKWGTRVLVSSWTTEGRHVLGVCSCSWDHRSQGLNLAVFRLAYVFCLALQYFNFSISSPRFKCRAMSHKIPDLRFQNSLVSHRTTLALVLLSACSFGPHYLARHLSVWFLTHRNQIRKDLGGHPAMAADRTEPPVHAGIVIWGRVLPLHSGFSAGP